MSDGLARTAGPAPMWRGSARYWRARARVQCCQRGERRQASIEAFWRCTSAMTTARDSSSAKVHNQLTARRSTAARSANHKLIMELSSGDDFPGGNLDFLCISVASDPPRAGRQPCVRARTPQSGEELRRGCECVHSYLCGLTFELTGRQRQDARPGLAKMYRVPPGRAWWPAVGSPVERGVRLHLGGSVD